MGYRKLTNYEVPKHLAAIHISNRLSFLERKVSNVLLRNAWSDLLDQEAHTILISDLADAVGFDSKNTAVIKDALRQLVNATIEWNILGQDKKHRWRASGILGSVGIDDDTGICEYTYPKHLRELFRNPNIFARLNLIIQRQFDSKYSLALWEYATGQIALSGVTSESMLTPWVDLDDLHKLLGSCDSQYPERYKKFNQDILKPAISEVNRVSDIEITNTEQKREKRKIVALRFEINSKDSYQLPLDLDVPRMFMEDERPALPPAASEEKNSLMERLIELGVEEKVARGLVRGFGVERITENLDWAVKQIQSGRDIERPAGFITSAIRRDFVAPERVKRRKVTEIKEREQSRQEIETVVEKVEGDFWLHIVATVTERLTAMSVADRAAFEADMEAQDVFRSPERWETYRREGITDRREHTPIRSMFYHFAKGRLLTDTERDVLVFARSQGLPDAVIAKLEEKKLRR
jgi:hypothetical protein